MNAFANQIKAYQDTLAAVVNQKLLAGLVVYGLAENVGRVRIVNLVAFSRKNKALYVNQAGRWLKLQASGFSDDKGLAVGMAERPREMAPLGRSRG